MSNMQYNVALPNDQEGHDERKKATRARIALR
jgi:hypothetical protein